MLQQRCNNYVYKSNAQKRFSPLTPLAPLETEGLNTDLLTLSNFNFEMETEIIHNENKEAGSYHVSTVAV